MPEEPIQIRRYPNRRFYNRDTSKYVSLQEIETLIQTGKRVEIHDSQSDKDLTRSVLTRLIMERQPEKMLLFPTDMLHCILRSNDVMTDFLRDYFQHSLTYLNYLQRHGTTVTPLTSPMHWVKAWLDGITPTAPTTASEPKEQAEPLAQKVAQLEERLRQLEAGNQASDTLPSED